MLKTDYHGQLDTGFDRQELPRPFPRLTKHNGKLNQTNLLQFRIERTHQEGLHIQF